MARLDYQRKPKRPPRWPWVVISLYAVGLGVCWLLDPRYVSGAMEGWSCLLVSILAVVGGIKFGTQERDYWA